MIKKFMGVPVVSSVLVLMLAAPSVNANLINGSFDDPLLPGPIVKDWGVAKLYDASTVNGWSSNNGFIELWNVNGNTFAELNSHNSNDPWDLRQEVSLTQDVEYELAFSYKARVNDEESFSVSIDSLNSTLDLHVTNAWTTYSQSFYASADGLFDLTFNSDNGGSLGNFIDDVSYTAITTTTNIPEPATFALLGLCLAGFGFRRNKVKH